jgi:hypothetical protein
VGLGGLLLALPAALHQAALDQQLLRLDVHVRPAQRAQLPAPWRASRR